MSRIARLFLLVPLVGLTVACTEKDEDDDSEECEGEDCEEEDEEGGDEGGDDGGGTTGDDWDPDSVEGVIGELSDGSQVWVLQAKDDTTWLSIENYPSYGGATGPESRDIGAVEGSYAECGVCLLLQKDCEPHGDHAHCGPAFMPEPGGTVTFEALDDAAGGAWTGTLSDVTFVEVEIGDGFETTPVDGGETFTISEWSFDVVLEAG